MTFMIKDKITGRIAVKHKNYAYKWEFRDAQIIPEYKSYMTWGFNKAYATWFAHFGWRFADWNIKPRNPKWQVIEID